MSKKTEDQSAFDLLLAFCMLIAGIVGVATRKSKGGGIVAGVFYLLGGLLGIVNYGSFSDLAIWSVLCFIFGAVFIPTSGKEHTSQQNKNSKFFHSSLILRID